VAAGDIDGDGRPEIVGVRSPNVVIAFEHDGTLKWSITTPASLGGNTGAVTIADLNLDQKPEIVYGATVLNANGTLKWQRTESSGGSAFGAGSGGISVLADLIGDGVGALDGELDVVAGNTAYRGSDGAILWRRGFADGVNAVANLDDDAFPEVVLSAGSSLAILNVNGTTGRVFGAPAAGPPLVGDFVKGDGGAPEVVVAGFNTITAYRPLHPTAVIVWQATVSEPSGNAGASAFDFDGDGDLKIVYADVNELHVFRGSDGTRLLRFPLGSSTRTEYPVIADVDNDGHAEIVVASPTQGRIFVFGAKDGDWTPARKVWNQHSYHVTNVNDDGTIPSVQDPGDNTYRVQALAAGTS